MSERAIQPVASRERVAEVLDGKGIVSADWEGGLRELTRPERFRVYSALLAAGVFREAPDREQILSAMIAAIYEDEDEPLVRQGMPTTEWNLLSIAADAVVGLLRGSRDPQA